MNRRPVESLVLTAAVLILGFSTAFADTAPPTVELELFPSYSPISYIDGEGVANDLDGVANVEYRYSKDGGAWTAWSPTVPEDGAFDEAEEWYDFVSHFDGYLYGLPSGEYTFQVRATDVNGNSTAPGDYPEASVTIDTDPPTVSIDPFPNPTADPTPTFTGTASDPHGVCVLYYRTRQQAGAWSSWIAAVGPNCEPSITNPSPVSFSFDLGPLADGVYDLEYYARDDAYCCTSAECGYDPITFTVAVPPRVVAVDVDTDPVYDGDLTQQVQVAFDEPMDESFPPTIGFSAGAFSSMGDGSWSAGTTTWTETFRLVDNDESIPDVLVHVSGARDPFGCSQTDYIAEPEFDIDTLNPAWHYVPQWAIFPTGVGTPCGFLDRDLPLDEGEAAPMLGLRPLCAIYEIGELLTGSCAIRDPQGGLVRGSYVHIYVYSVDLTTRPEVVSLLAHWVSSLDRSLDTHPIAWDTTDQLPGCYDVYLSNPHGSAHTCRIRLVASEE